MAQRDDVTKVLAACKRCQSAYAARQWPDGSIQLIGQDECGCGSAEFEVVDGSDIGADDTSDEPGTDEAENESDSVETGAESGAE